MVPEMEVERRRWARAEPLFACIRVGRCDAGSRRSTAVGDDFGREGGFLFVRCGVV